MARSSRLRALPLGVLVAFVAVLVASRVRAPPTGRDYAPHARPPAASVQPAPVASGLDAPLHGTAPPDAGTPRGAPRMVHGAPSHAHRAAARGPKTVRIGWRVELGAPVTAQVTASPDESTLYAATLDGTLVALARDTGAKRWSVGLGERVYSTPFVADDGTVVVGSDAKKLVAVSPKGDVLWRLEVDGEVDTGAAPLREGTIVVAAGRELLAVRRGGDVAWRFAAKDKIFTSPAVTSEGLVIVGSQDDRVYAVSSAGTLAWSVDLGADVDGAAAIGDDGAIFVGTDRGEIVRLDAHGAISWRTQVFGFVRGVLSIARNGDILAGTYGPVPRVVRVAPDGAIRGAFAIHGTGAKEFGIHGGPLEDDEGTLFFGAQDDAVYAVGRGGDVRWRFETKGDVDAPLTMLGDGSLVVPSEDGTITMLLP
ncbi:MAG TPA: PQQ-binding-like beta-propeller repeat protein [Labilithrix sp.]